MSRNEGRPHNHPLREPVLSGTIRAGQAEGPLRHEPYGPAPAPPPGGTRDVRGAESGGSSTLRAGGEFCHTFLRVLAFIRLGAVGG